MTSYTLRKGNPDKTRADVVVVGIARNGKGPVVASGGEPVAKAYGRRFAPLLASLGVTGKAGEAFRVPTSGAVTSATLVLVGLGDLARGSHQLTAEQVRRAAGVAARNVGNAASVALALPAADAVQVRAVAEGFLAGSYAFHGSKAGAKKKPVSEVAILSEAARRKDCVDALGTAQVLAGFADTARDWVNTPANQLFPAEFADQVRAIERKRKKPKVKVTVLDEVDLEDLGCGGILGVGMGSDNPPRLVKLEYRPEGAAKHVALVGKGITYDSGGLTIKPGGSMATMKCDMAGAAAVIAATYTLAELGVPVAVTAYAPLAENMISGRAVRPGDVLTMYGGKTVEVMNTDAEGRLVLADALAMAAELDPDVIVEISTLTGPCVVALGDRVAGVFGDDETVADVQAAAETTGELMWRLPVPEETREQIRTESKVADLLQHNWVRWGSALWAAGFLTEFVDGKPFVHLDVAGPACNDGAPWGHVPSGGTGYGIPTLVEYVAVAGAATRSRLSRSCCRASSGSADGCTRASGWARRPPPRRTTGCRGGCRSRAPSAPTAPGAGSTRRRARPAAASPTTPWSAARGSLRRPCAQRTTHAGASRPRCRTDAPVPCCCGGSGRTGPWHKCDGHTPARGAEHGGRWRAGSPGGGGGVLLRSARMRRCPIPGR